MPVLFSSRPGQVTAVQSAKPVPASLFIEGWSGYPGIQAIITSIAGANQTIAQFSHGQLDEITIYTFGERIGDLRISGLAFGDSCEGGGVSGIEQVAEYYARNRASVRGLPITVQLGLSGGSRVQGFLVGFAPELTDPERRLAQFSLLMKVLTPEAAAQS